MSLLLFSLACRPEPSKQDDSIGKNKDSPDVEQDDSAADSSPESSPTESEPVPECTQNSDCNDEIDCTKDHCEDNGSCSYTAENNLCSTDLTCMEAICAPEEGGCIEQQAPKGAACEANTCSAGDTCDENGVCLEGNQEDEIGDSCSTSMGCSEGSACGGNTEDGHLCRCTCTGGEIYYELQGLIADSRSNVLTGGAILIRLEDGTESGWFSCPEELEDFANRSISTEQNAAVLLRYPCNPDDSIAGWYTDILAGRITRRSGSLIGVDSSGVELLRVNFYEGTLVSLTPYDALNESAYTTCIEYVELQILVEQLERG